VSSASVTAIDRTAPGNWRLSGTLEFINAADALTRGDALFAAEKSVEVDLSALGKVDSAALAVLIAWSVRARKRGAKIAYRSAPEPLLALARSAEVERLLGLQH
jgi:phospholipid transport system transporter-binding protein